MKKLLLTGFMLSSLAAIAVPETANIIQPKEQVFIYSMNILKLSTQEIQGAYLFNKIGNVMGVLGGAVGAVMEYRNSLKKDRVISSICVGTFFGAISTFPAAAGNNLYSYILKRKIVQQKIQVELLKQQLSPAELIEIQERIFNTPEARKFLVLENHRLADVEARKRIDEQDKEVESNDLFKNLAILGRSILELQ